MSAAPRKDHLVGFSLRLKRLLDERQ